MHLVQRRTKIQQERQLDGDNQKGKTNDNNDAKENQSLTTNEEQRRSSMLLVCPYNNADKHIVYRYNSVLLSQLRTQHNIPYYKQPDKFKCTKAIARSTPFCLNI